MSTGHYDLMVIARAEPLAVGHRYIDMGIFMPGEGTVYQPIFVVRESTREAYLMCAVERGVERTEAQLDVNGLRYFYEVHTD